jgi:ACS family pantothenate transporter-like MFS transporter
MILLSTRHTLAWLALTMDEETTYRAKSANEIFDREVHSDRDSEGQDGLWLRFLTYLRWYPSEMPHLEKRLILKLDILILVFGCLSFFTKYLDQQAITNAYVSYVV